MKFLCNFVVFILVLHCSLSYDSEDSDQIYSETFSEDIIPTSRSIVIKRDFFSYNVPTWGKRYKLTWRKTTQNSVRKLTINSTKNDVVINDLEPCTEYQITVTVKNKERQKNIPRTVKTLAEAPSSVTNLNYFYKNKILNVTWSPPENAPNCVRFYTVNVTVNEHGSQISSFRTTYNTYYTFNNIPSEDYKIIVRPEGEDFLQNGDFESVTVSEDSKEYSWDDYLDRYKNDVDDSIIDIEETTKSNSVIQHPEPRFLPYHSVTRLKKSTNYLPREHHTTTEEANTVTQINSENSVTYKKNKKFHTTTYDLNTNTLESTSESPDITSRNINEDYTKKYFGYLENNDLDVTTEYAEDSSRTASLHIMKYPYEDSTETNIKTYEKLDITTEHQEENISGSTDENETEMVLGTLASDEQEKTTEDYESETLQYSTEANSFETSTQYLDEDSLHKVEYWQNSDLEITTDRHEAEKITAYPSNIEDISIYTTTDELGLTTENLKNENSSDKTDDLITDVYEVPTESSMITAPSTTVSTQYTNSIINTNEESNIDFSSVSSTETFSETTDSSTVISSSSTPTTSVITSESTSTSNSWIETTPTTPPICNVKLSITLDGRSSDELHLTWTVIWNKELFGYDCDAYMYIVYWASDNSHQSELVYEKEVTLYNLSPCTKYDIYVEARNSYNYTLGRNGTIRVATFPESEVVEKVQVKPDSHSLEISWSPPECQLFNYIYSVTLEESFTTFNTSKQFIKIQNLESCQYYNYIILPMITDEENWIGQEYKGYDRTIPNKNASVQNINIFPNIQTLKVSWEPPEGSDVCNFTYNVYNVHLGHEENIANSLTNTEILINKLDPCTQYNFGVTPVYDGRELQRNYKNSTTLDAVPEAVKDLDRHQSDLTEESWKPTYNVTFSWKRPKANATCIANYQFLFWQDNKPVFKSQTVEENVVTFDKYLCTNYSLEVWPVSFGGQNGEKRLVYSWRQKVNDPPVLHGNTTEEDCDTCITQWSATDNNCKILYLIVFCVSITENDINSCVRDVKQKFKVTDEKSYENIVANLTKLSPNGEYQCNACLENIAGFSRNSSDFTITTKEGVPDSPQNLKVFEEDSSFEISWVEPLCPNGILQNYSLRVEYIPDNNIRKECRKPPTVLDISLPENITFFNFTEMHFYSNYNIEVSASTGAGWGKPYNCIYRTRTSEPGPPENIQTEFNKAETVDYDVNLTLSWYGTCNRNGIITYYTVIINSKIYNISVNAEDHYSIADIPLYPAQTYVIIINANNENYTGEPANVTILSPAAIPHIKNDTKPIIVQPNEVTNTSITVTLDSEVFNSSLGEILYYALIFGEDGCMEPPTQGYYSANEADWPKINSSCDSERRARSITPEKWNPFNITEQHQIGFVIGSNKCNNDLCSNNTLKPNTKYALKLRGFTADSFSDTKIFYVQTNPTEYYEGPDVALITGIIFGVLGVMIISALLYYTKGRLSYLKSWHLRNSVLANSDSPAPQPVPIKKFIIHYKKMMENTGKIKSEFQLLQTLSTDVMLSTREAGLPINKRKNRYINILPFDENRVKLHVKNTSDYINGSYIKGYTQNIEYIATQGPTESTCAAFWQMIFDENVRIIIMLTQFVEQGKEKCYKYFPNVMEESSIEANDMLIQCVEENVYEIYTQRKIIAIKKDKQKEILHLLFNKWPDFGVPTKISHMIYFCEKMIENKKNYSGCIAVHCSAGVGRTGTLIALDILMQAIKNKQKVDIFGTVFNLRKQRMMMVQSEKQYEFLYKCVQEIILRKGQKNSSHEINRISETDM